MMAAPIPGLGNVAFAILYAFFCVCCLVSPSVVERLGPKTAMIIGALPYPGLLFVHLAPEWCGDEGRVRCWDSSALYMLNIPIYALVGVCGTLLWNGQNVYLARCAQASVEQFAANADADGCTDHSGVGSNSPTLADVLKQYNGIFFSYFQANGFVGVVTGCLVLTLLVGDAKAHAVYYLFLGMGIVCSMGCAMLITLPAVNPSSAESQRTANVRIAETFSLLTSEKRLQLVAPMIFYNGMSMGLIYSTFNSYAWQVIAGTSFSLAPGKACAGRVKLSCSVTCTAHLAR